MCQEDRVKWLYEQTYGPVDKGFRLEIEDEVIYLVKGEKGVCDHTTLSELLIDYATKDIDFGELC
jgi:hypothetical protein